MVRSEIENKVSELLNGKEFPLEELDLLVMCTEIEEEFGINVDYRAYASWKDSADIVDYVIKELNGEEEGYV